MCPSRNDVAVSAFLVGSAASITAGIALAIIYDNAAWLLLALPIVFFLS